MRRIRIAAVLAGIILAFSFIQAGVAIIEADVDGSDYLLVRGNRVDVQHRGFEPLSNLRFRFDPVAGLPESNLIARVIRIAGSGPVTIVEQPQRSNNYTLKILIDNDNERTYPQSYQIRVEWDEPRNTGYYGSGNFDRQRFDACHWQGEVDGTDLIRIQGRQVTVEHVRALPVQNQQYEFTAPLPAAANEVQLETVQGRGRLEIVQQPGADNNYTAVVRVDDGRFGGSDFYEFHLYWEKTNQTASTQDFAFTWEGRVDGTDYLLIKGQTVQIEHLRAQPVQNSRYDFRLPLPAREQTISLTVLEGRGRVQILEQPTRLNNYTAKILLDDDKDRGAAMYRIGLTWKGGKALGTGRLGSPERRDQQHPPQQAGGVIRWRGTVDGRDELRFQGEQVTIRHLEAGPVRNPSAVFSDPVPVHPVKVTLNIITGRGEVRILEQPTHLNNYTIVVEIIDSKNGAAEYEFELAW